MCKLTRHDVTQLDVSCNWLSTRASIWRWSERRSCSRARERDQRRRPTAPIAYTPAASSQACFFVIVAYRAETPAWRVRGLSMHVRGDDAPAIIMTSPRTWQLAYKLLVNADSSTRGYFRTLCSVSYNNIYPKTNLLPAVSQDAEGQERHQGCSAPSRQGRREYYNCLASKLRVMVSTV